jgi:hypothetical protein
MQSAGRNDVGIALTNLRSTTLTGIYIKLDRQKNSGYSFRLWVKIHSVAHLNGLLGCGLEVLTLMTRPGD